MIVESDAPPTILRSLRELRLVPPPRCRGAGWFAPWPAGAARLQSGANQARTSCAL